MRRVEGILKKIDWLLVAFILPIVFASLFTMKNFSVLEASNTFFEKQMIWLSIGFAIFFLSSFFDFRFLKQTNILVALFLFNSFLLLLLFILGHVSHGAKSWFNFGFFSFQPVDTMKLILILILSKYFSRRHVEIGDIKHIFISGFYAFVPFVLVLMQPDFGSAMIIGLIWLGMVMVSGISKTHLFVVFGLGILTFLAFWFLLFAPYQKARIMNFIDPLSDIHGTGYNAFQSTIAVGSGQVLGKGLGFGTQSRLKFLPQPQSDFIFASFSEEWGFVGSILVLILFGLIVWRIIYFSTFGEHNFETLFALGVAIFFMSHILINVGMNLGLMPITGVPLPIMSYGGSHLVIEFMALGILMSMRKYERPVHRDDTKLEFLGA